MLAAWQGGATGFPLVDAGMRQLWATGWMQQSVRMVCAAFLTEYLSVSWVSERHAPQLPIIKPGSGPRLNEAFSGMSSDTLVLMTCCCISWVVARSQSCDPRRENTKTKEWTNQTQGLLCGPAPHLMPRCAGRGLPLVPRHARGRGPGD